MSGVDKMAVLMEQLDDIHVTIDFDNIEGMWFFWQPDVNSTTASDGKYYADVDAAVLAAAEYFNINK